MFASGLGAAEQSLIFNGSVGGGYDDNLLLEQPGGITDPRLAKSGGLGLLNASLGYSLNKDRVLLGVSAGSSSRYFPGQELEFLGSHYAGAGLTVQMGSRTTLTAQQSVTYQPYTFATMLPIFDAPELGQLPNPALDFATGAESYFTLTSNLTFSRRLSPRTVFSAGYDHQQSETAFINGRFSRHGGTAGVRHTLTQALGLRLGYGYQTSQYLNSTTKIDNHNIDVGVDYRKALSFSRRSTLSFSTGTAAVSDGSNTSYRAIGSATLDHELGRTWLATASFDRSVQFVDLVAAPVLQDSLGAGVGGLLHRRVQVRSGVRASIGTIGFGQGTNNNDFDTYLASAGLAFFVSRHVSMNLDYGFYRYRFDQGIPLPFGIPRNVDRQTVRASVGVWAPLFQKARR